MITFTAVTVKQDALFTRHIPYHSHVTSESKDSPPMGEKLLQNVSIELQETMIK